MTTEKQVRIMLALNRTSGAAPIGYISKHSGIDEPYELLQQLEEEGLVSRAQPTAWSASLMPLFELTDKAREFLQEIINDRIEQFSSALA